MPTVDFVPFATEDGANVVDLPTYKAEASTATGFVTGIAYSNECNRVWRQSSFMAAVLANFMSQVTNTDVLDDGNLAGAIAKLLLSVTEVANQQIAVAIAGLGIQALFYGPGSYVVTVPATNLKVVLQGGGGGGGDGGGGGGAGARLTYYLTGLVVGRTLNLIVGDGGAGGVSGGNGVNGTATALSTGSQTIFPASAGGGHGGHGSAGAPGLGGTFFGGTFGSIGNGGGSNDIPGVAVNELGAAWGSGGGEFFFPDLAGLPGAALFEFVGTPTL